MNKEAELKVPTFRLGELTAISVSVEQTLCRWWPWRNDDEHWRNRVRDCIAILRKIKQARWA